MPKRHQAQKRQQAEPAQGKAVNRKTEPAKTAVNDPNTVLQRVHNDSNEISPNDARILQRTIGNQALRRLTIQRKMTLGPVGDKYEQEADAVASQVVAKLNAPQPLMSANEMIRRKEEEDELQMKPLPAISSLQRQEEEDELQMKGDSLMGGELNSDVETAVSNAKSGGRPLADPVRNPMEQAFNADFSGVNIHTGNEADTLNRSLSARAFTTGQDIFFRSGEYNPSSSSGQELIAHELTHTIQQGSAPVQRQHESATTANHSIALIGKLPFYRLNCKKNVFT